jgi:hypothetical protein
MRVKFIVTHVQGKSINVHRLEQELSYDGQLTVYLAAVEGLRRASRVAALRPLQNNTGTRVLPDLHDIELLAFGERAMMLAGFEEISERRFYQGWWVRWD